jgi:hypothetical protein
VIASSPQRPPAGVLAALGDIVAAMSDNVVGVELAAAAILSENVQQ